MLEIVRNKLSELDVQPGAELWVGVSGGVDSMVLLHVLRALGHPCHVAHVDHGLRGAASTDDGAFVEAYCASEGIPFRIWRADVAGRLEDHAESTQMAARELRLGWFRELLAEGPSRMALAHHADDRLETFFLGLMRGMGTRGWSSIPASYDAFIRPLIEVEKAAILAYASEHGIVWREDPSNQHPEYLRNRVRSEWIPMLEELRPGARRVIHRAMDLLSDMEQLAMGHVAVTVTTFTSGEDGVLRCPLETLNGPGSLLVLHELLRERGFHPDQIKAMRRAVRTRRTGAVFIGERGRALVDRTHLLISALPAPRVEWRITDINDIPLDCPLRVRTSAPSEVMEDLGAGVVWIDPARAPFPWTLRPWKAGDRMQPSGMHGTKRISDMLINAKVDRFKKEGSQVLCSGDRIIWLCGMRLAEGVKAARNSGPVLRLDWMGN